MYVWELIERLQELDAGTEIEVDMEYVNIYSMIMGNKQKYTISTAWLDPEKDRVMVKVDTM